MEEKLISIIVPVYNAQNYLKQCVDSIVNQTYNNLEIILVDDGAEDKSPEMCDAYAAADHRIEVIHKENGGLMSAWMAGVKKSRGDYLSFIDSDDWVETDMMEVMLQKTSGCPGEIICGNFVIERTGGITEHYHELPPGIYEGLDLEKKVKSRLLGNERRTISMSRCMKLFSRELIVDNLGFCNPKIKMGEDVNIVLPALLDCKRVVILEGALHYHYFYNDTSIVHKYDGHMYEGIRILTDTIKEIFMAKNISDWESQWEEEKLFLLLLAVKNELRGGRMGYMERIRQICKDEKLNDVADRYKAEPEDKVNKLLLWVVKKPSAFRCMLGKMIFEVFDKVRR